MKKILFIIFAFVCIACTDSEIQKNPSRATSITRSAAGCIISSSNPQLLNNWENVNTITLNTSSNGSTRSVTSPWGTGTSSMLPEDFRKDIKKEDGWTMLFHTFKEVGLNEKQNYMCFYNQLSGMMKIFYYYEGDRNSQGTHWIMKTSNNKKNQLFNITGYLSIPMDSCSYNSIILSNFSEGPSNGMMPGWNGFEFEIPYSEEGQNTEFTIGAYDRNITYYDFNGNLEMESHGTITPISNSTSGILSSCASLAGSGAKSIIDKLTTKAKNDSAGIVDNNNSFKFGTSFAKLIAKVPASSYTNLISSGLKLIFGKTSVINNSKIQLSTTGKASFTGTSTSETTSGIPSITFNIHDLINTTIPISNNSSLVYNFSDSGNHCIGNWNLESNPRVCYRRISKVLNPLIFSTKGPLNPFDRSEFNVSLPYHWGMLSQKINPDISQYIISSNTTYDFVRADTIDGKPYLPQMIDIGDPTWQELIFHDNNVTLFSTEGNDFHASYVYKGGDPRNYDDFYFDWGNIDYGRNLVIVTRTCTYNYLGKEKSIIQSRTYPARYFIEVSYIEDVPQYNYGNKHILNCDYPFFEEYKRNHGFPIIDYEE